MQLEHGASKSKMSQDLPIYQSTYDQDYDKRFKHKIVMILAYDNDQWSKWKLLNGTKRIREILV